MNEYQRHAPLAEKVALVTGGGRGIGAAIAARLAEDGADVAVCDVDAALAAGVAEQAAASFGRRAFAVWMDVAEEASVREGLAAVGERLGPVDVLVNNAGINRDRSIRKMSANEWDEVIQTNLNSVFHCTKAVMEPMISRGWGRIINIASIIGQTGAFGQANYAAAKAGVIAFTKSVAQELAKFGITVNAICPGFVDTDMMATMPPQAKEAVKSRIPLGRFGDADEVARLVRFLSCEGDWITGAQLNINGGQFM